MNPSKHPDTWNTEKRAEGMRANQNITLSLPEEDCGRRRYWRRGHWRRGAVPRCRSFWPSSCREMVKRETGYDVAKGRSMALLREGADLGTGGRVTWSRDDLHER